MNIYDELYENIAINYGGLKTRKGEATDREKKIYSKVMNFLNNYGANQNSRVLEIGCALGFNHDCHVNYLGIEYSKIAVEQAQKRFSSANIKQDDASDLSFSDSEFDFIFSISVLEHIPKIEQALSEIDRVLRKGGLAYLAPAWNCRIWTVQKLDFLNYGELPLKKKIAKFLIPLRQSIFYRFAFAFPLRLLDEIKCLIGLQPHLRYRKLPVNLDLIKKFGHVADDDAYIDIDAHTAMMFYASKGYEIISHPTLISRLLCRGDEIVIKKK